MDENLQEVNTVVGNLRNMAIDIGTELSNQNRQLERIHLKVSRALLSRFMSASDYRYAFLSYRSIPLMSSGTWTFVRLNLGLTSGSCNSHRNASSDPIRPTSELFFRIRHRNSTFRPIANPAEILLDRPTKNYNPSSRSLYRNPSS
jgi:hypothetical protein